MEERIKSIKRDILSLKDKISGKHEGYYTGQAVGLEFVLRLIDDAFPKLKESEDERIRRAIHIYLDWLDGRKDCQPKGDYTIRDMIAYLESRKEQHPAEWSEEDKQNLELIIDCIMMHYPDPVVKYKLKDWLKFLRPRFYWRPSEDQMEVFVDSIYFLGQKGFKDPNGMIESLYQDLKKL